MVRSKFAEVRTCFANTARAEMPMTCSGRHSVLLAPSLIDIKRNRIDLSCLARCYEAFAPFRCAARR